MATPAMFPSLAVGVSLEEAAGPVSPGPAPGPAPQLVLLASVAAAADAGGDKEMMELKTVGGNYWESEEESSIRWVLAVTRAQRRSGWMNSCFMLFKLCVGTWRL